MKERLVIVVIAVIAGLFITTAGFFIYQSTKKSADAPVTATADTKPTATPLNNLYIKISEPSDESLTQKRTIQVKGTTNPGNAVIVSTNQEDVAGIPTPDGNFSITIDIDAGANQIIARGIAPDGETVQDVRTVTYSTDDF
jgi:hypothetical protein